MRFVRRETLIMNRTFQAGVILALAVLTLVVAWYGLGLRRQAEQARQEWRELEATVERKSAELAQKESDQRARAARRLAVSHRLKKVAGARAQAAATGAPEESLRGMDQEILTLEQELRLLQQPDDGRQ